MQDHSQRLMTEISRPNKLSLRQKYTPNRDKPRVFNESFEVESSCTPSLSQLSNFEGVNCLQGPMEVNTNRLGVTGYLRNKYTISTTSSTVQL